MSSRAARILLVALIPAATTLAQAARSGNPILPGWYADPEAHVFDGQYWIYPDLLRALRSANAHGRVLVDGPGHVGETPARPRRGRCLLGTPSAVGAVDRREGRLVLSLLRRERHPERPANRRNRRRPRPAAHWAIQGLPRQAYNRQVPQRCPADRSIRIQEL